MFLLFVLISVFFFSLPVFFESPVWIFLDAGQVLLRAVPVYVNSVSSRSRPSVVPLYTFLYFCTRKVTVGAVQSPWWMTLKLPGVAWPVASRVVVQLLLFCCHVWNLLSRDKRKRLFAFHSLLRVPYLCLNFFYFTTHFNTAATIGHYSLLYLSLYLLFLPFYSFSSSSSFSLHSRGGAGRGQMSCHHPTLPSSSPSLYYSQ